MSVIIGSTGARYQVIGVLAGTSAVSVITTTSKTASFVSLGVTNFRITGLELCVTSTTDAGRFCVDIGVGESGSEVVLVSDIMVQLPGFGPAGSDKIIFPLSIPSSTRVGVRASTSGGTGNHLAIMMLLYGGSFNDNQVFGRVSTFGVSNQSAFGTVIDPGATINTKGNWISMGVTSSLVKQLNIVLGMGANTAVTTAVWYVDFGIGVSGSQQIIISNIAIATNTTPDDLRHKNIGPLPINIASGTILWMRSQCTINNATDRLIECALYGIS